jgi:hypothetical protein
MTSGSGCPPPLLVSRSILQHVRDVCQARTGLNHLPIVQQPTTRASTSPAPRGMRTIQDSPCVNHLPVGTSFQMAQATSSHAPQPASGPPRQGHASVLQTTPSLVGSDLDMTASGCSAPAMAHPLLQLLRSRSYCPTWICRTASRDADYAPQSRTRGAGARLDTIGKESISWPRRPEGEEEL